MLMVKGIEIYFKRMVFKQYVKLEICRVTEIKSELLNGTKAKVDEYLNHWSKNTGEIWSVTAVVVGDQVSFKILTRCVNTHDWDAYDFSKTYEVGTCQVTEKVVSKVLVHENNQCFVVRFGISEDHKQILIDVKQERSHWMSLTGHYQNGLYQMVEFTPLKGRFSERDKDFFIQPDFQPIAKTRNLTEEQYEMLTRLHTPLENKKLREDVKHILLNGVARDDKEAAIRENDFMNQMKITNSIDDFRMLKSRIEWLNGWYARQGPDNIKERIDVILPTIGFQAASREQTVIEAISHTSYSLTLEEVSKMYRRDITELRKIMARYNKGLKIIHEIRPYFYTNIRLYWNP